MKPSNITIHINGLKIFLGTKKEKSKMYINIRLLEVSYLDWRAAVNLVCVSFITRARESLFLTMSV